MSKWISSTFLPRVIFEMDCIRTSASSDQETQTSILDIVAHLLDHFGAGFPIISSLDFMRVRLVHLESDIVRLSFRSLSAPPAVNQLVNLLKLISHIFFVLKLLKMVEHELLYPV